MQNESEVRAVIARLREWGDLPLHVTHLQSVEAIFDQEHRHKRGAKPVDYLRSWLSMLRPFAFATKDDSWGEMEKLLCIVLRNYIEVRRDADEAAARLEAALLAERQAIADAERGTCEMPEVAAMRFIEQLRSNYGTVTILPDNEEASSRAEQTAIDCCGEWTNWQDQRFYGESVVQCLAKAVVVKERSDALLFANEHRSADDEAR